jgi:hypothetical protein
MSGKKISQLPVQLSLNTTGVTAVVQDGVTYKVDLQTLKDFINTTGTTATTIYSEDGTLWGDRIVNLSGYTLTFSGETGTTLTIVPNTIISGSLTVNQGVTGSLFGTSSFAQTSSLAYDLINRPFLYNKTNTVLQNVVRVNETIFNPTNLTVVSGSIFIVEQDAEYYVLGDLVNSGSILVDGTIKIGGVLYNQGDIIGTGIIE